MVGFTFCIAALAVTFLALVSQYGGFGMWSSCQFIIGNAFSTPKLKTVGKKCAQE